eukprot:13250611-Ditylum_brightwellii.AAC.1
MQYSSPLSVDLATARSCRAEAKAAYLACKPNAEDMCLAFLLENEDIPIRDREEEAEKVIQKIIKKKNQELVGGTSMLHVEYNKWRVQGKWWITKMALIFGTQLKKRLNVAL